MNKILHGDCIEVLPTLPDNSVDSIVTDPPYGLSFMGKAWDNSVPSVDVWRECLRVLKPGGHLLAFAGTRTQHRMAVNIEDSGFEIRDMIAWVYGSGFPKSHNIGKAVDKMQGNEREVIGKGSCGYQVSISKKRVEEGYRPKLTNATTETVISKGNSQWEGWGTALKPSLEPITVARKPFKSTVAQNVLEHGTGGLNIDGCRVGTDKMINPPTKTMGGNSLREYGVDGRNVENWKKKQHESINREPTQAQGRWPANLIHDGSDEVLGLFPVTGKSSGGQSGVKKSGLTYSANWNEQNNSKGCGYGDSGSAARFFYCAKASKADRGESNKHPTVKPTALMRYLCRLVTPPNGTVLDPFMGSGSTGKACKMEGFGFIGIELEPEYIEIAKARIENVKIPVTSKTLFD